MVPQGHNGQTPDDLGITTRLPSICVDYLSHDWAEDDVWTSWKAMTRHKSEIANGVRLENASWRTWAKQRGNLKTISPETLNWLKDSDVTWLYGPLHTAVDAVPPPRVATASERLGLEPLRSLSDAKAEQAKNAKLAAVGTPGASGPSATGTGTTPSSTPGAKKRKPAIVTKPILKYRSLSDILLPPNTPASPVLESIDELDHAGAGLPSNRSAADLRRTNSTGGSRARISAASPSHSPRNGSPDRAMTSDSSSSNGGRRHISFNHRVEQCIAVDSTEEAKNYPSHHGSGYPIGQMPHDSDDSDDGDDEDDVLTFASSSPRTPHFGPASMSKAGAANSNRKSSGSSNADREPHTIARLGPTTLKSTELWPAPSPMVVYQTYNPNSPTAGRTPTGKLVDSPPQAQQQQPVATYTTRPASQPAGGRKPMYDYGNTDAAAAATANNASSSASAGGMASQWDPDDDEDYAMGFDYFNGPDVLVGDEYDMAQYGSQHLVGTSHNNYQGGTQPSYSASPAQSTSGSIPNSYNPYAPSPSSASSSTDSSPANSRRSSNPPSVASSPSSGSSPSPANANTATAPSASVQLRGPHVPQPSASSQPSKRSALKAGASPRSRENSGASLDEGSPSSSSSPGRFGSPIASPPGSGATSPQTRPTVRRAGSEEFREPRDREGRGRSASRGSSSSLERSASADRRSSLSPASSYVSLNAAAAASSGGGGVGVGGGSGGGGTTRPIGIPGSRRGGSSDALNTLAGGMPGSRLMPDLPEASSESETETIKTPNDDDNEEADDSEIVVVPQVDSVSAPQSPVIAVETLEDATLPSMDDAPAPLPPPTLSSSSSRPTPPPITIDPSSPPPALPSGPPLVPAPPKEAPRYRQPSPAKPASSTTTDTPAHASPAAPTSSSAAPQSLSSSPSITPADLASATWSDEPPPSATSSEQPSYARRSLLRAARSLSEEGRTSSDQGRPNSANGVQTDDYGFGYYDEDGGETGTAGIAGTARDIIGALSRGLWNVASGRR